MSLSTLWRDVANQWDDINSHANTLAFNIYDQEAWVMNALAYDVGKLWLNVSRSVSELELKTYNALHWVELVLKELVDNVDSTIEARFSRIEHIFNDHLEKITDYIEDAVNLVNQSGSMDYEYVDTEIYWAVYDVNLELDNISRRIDDITSINLSEVEALIDEAVTDLWTDTLLTIHIVNSELSERIDALDKYTAGELQRVKNWAGRQIDTMRDYVNAAAADITAYVDALGGDIVEWVNIKLGAAKQYIDNSVADALVDVDVAMEEVRKVLNQRITKVKKTLNEKREAVVDDLVVIITNTELRIMDKVQNVSGRVTSLTDTTDWRSGFFDIFRANPELSFLQVLLRDENKFAEFKPYWQALFTRVMSED